MVWISYSKESEEKQKKFLAMSEEEFDRHMCEKYPIMFRERNLPMNQTCMCWGFNIGKGWYSVLDELCEKLEFIYKQSNIRVIFQQVKEKYGGARFYFGTEKEKGKENNDDDKQWIDIISNEVSRAEQICDYVCAECGCHKNDTITIGGWVYDCCEKCLKKNERTAKGIKIWNDRKELEEEVEILICMGNEEENKELKNLIKSFESRIEKERAK